MELHALWHSGDSDLTPPDPNLSGTAVAYCCALTTAGWTCIGEGVGGRVFHRAGDDQVIKVSDGDRCYLLFADYASSHPTECVPKLAVVYRTDQWAVTHTEFLAPLDQDNSSSVEARWQQYMAARKQGSSTPIPAEWSAPADALQPLAIGDKCCFDMKQENAMQRGNVVVFVDPLN
jgi:hypothetical protein